MSATIACNAETPPDGGRLDSAPHEAGVDGRDAGTPQPEPAAATWLDTVKGDATSGPDGGEPFETPPVPAPPPPQMVEQLQSAFEQLVTTRQGIHTGLVMDMATETVVLARDEERELIPASLTKLYTTATALLRLGEAHTFRSEVGVVQSPAGSAHVSSLLLSSNEDPSWTEEFYETEDAIFTRLAERLREQGISRIRGNLILSGDFLVGGYRYGHYDVKQQRARAVELLQDWFQSHDALSLDGEVSFADELRPSKTLASVSGVTLDTLATHINRSSHNEFADLLLRHLAGELNDDSRRQSQPASPILNTLADLGVRLPTLHDGSGLDSRNRVTPSGVVELLLALDRTSVGEAWWRGFSVPGGVGTLYDRLRSPDTEMRVFAKTGSMTGVVATAGILFHRYDGRRYAFAFLSNAVEDEHAVRELHDLTLKVLAAPGNAPPRPQAPRLDAARVQRGQLVVEWSTAANDPLLIWFSRDGRVWRRELTRMLRSQSNQRYDAGPLPPGERIFVRLSHTGAGGDSEFSSTFVVENQNGPRVQLVDANSRIRMSQEDNPLGGGGHPFATRYASALDGRCLLETVSGEWFGRSPTTASTDAAEVLFWACGETGLNPRCFEEPMLLAVDQFLERGGSLFLSGSEVAWALSRPDAEGGGPSARRFLETRLKTRFIEDDAQSWFALEPGRSGSELSFYDPTWMKVHYPDRVSPTPDATPLLDYSRWGRSDGQGHAAISFAGRHRLVFLGFPFEAVASDVERRRLMDLALPLLAPHALRR